MRRSSGAHTNGETGDETGDETGEQGLAKVKTVDMLLEELGLWVEDLAERTSLSQRRVEAIALGRWTPSPDERLRIARALSVSVDEVSWGHTMDPRNVRYRRFGLKEDF